LVLVGDGLQGVETTNTYRVYLGNGQTVVWKPDAATVTME